MVFYIVVLLTLPVLTKGKCAIRGLCHEHHPGAYGPCVPPAGKIFSTIPFPHDDPTLLSLQKYCSYLIEDEAQNSTELCCTPQQAKGLADQIKQAEAILSRCPSCFDNFAKLWCEFTCSPRQASFLQVTERETISSSNLSFVSENEESKEYANRLDYHISKRFIRETYDSCKDVTFAGGPALRVMCTTSPCEMTSWLAFIGKQNLQLNIPVHTRFILEDENDLPLSDKRYATMSFTRCNESVRAGVSKCAKMECYKLENMKTIDLDDGKMTVETCQVHGIACMKILIILVFFSCLVITLCVSLLLQQKDAEDDDAFRRNGQEGRIKRTGAWIQRSLEYNAREIGIMAGRQPKYFFLVGLTLAVLSMIGMVYHQESRNVLDMWSSATSTARIEEDNFNNRFGRESRYEQFMIIANREKLNSKLSGPAFNITVVKQLFEIESDIKKLKAYDKDGRGITLDDVCHRPMGPGYDCLIMSPTNYFQGNRNTMNSKPVPVIEEAFDYFEEEPVLEWQQHFMECIDQEYSQNTSVGLSCFGPYGGPSAPNLIFGRRPNETSYKTAMTMMVTYALTQRDQTEIEKAELWEAEFINYWAKRIRNTSVSPISYSYMAERSIMDEIESEGQNEIMTIVIALCFLIGYVSFSLGRYFVCENSLCSILVHSRILLGFSSVIINTLSSFCSWGILSMLGIHPVKSALVVQFFLVTLLGVSRTFSTVKCYAQQRVASPYQGPDDLPAIVGNVMSATMPAFLGSSLSCVGCFLIGSIPNLPAVRSFCLYTAIAILFDVFLHCTLFLALFVLDTLRELKGQPEFWLTYRIKNLLDAYTAGRQKATDTFMTHIFKTVVGPFLMKTIVRVITGILFVSTFITAVVFSSKVEIGFDQSMAFTETSYISAHFRGLDKYMNAGPLLYYVTEGELDWHKPDVQNKFCTLPSCNELSFGNILQYAAEHTEESSIVPEVFNWIDSYLQWISRDSPCCKVYVHDPNTFCSTNRNSSLDDSDCRSCMDYDFIANSHPKNTLEYERPSREFFYKYLSYFLDDNPNSVCVFGGRASFKNAISFTSRGRIQASHFMTFFRKLKTSNSTDFVVAMEQARMVARRLKRAIDDTASVYAYSKFFPFYEQYSTIPQTLITQLVFTVVGVFAIIGLTLGIDIKGAACVIICKISNFFHIVALMYLFRIQINAISATILIMSSGIFIEFSSNILAGYLASKKTSSRDRAQETLSHIGAIMLSGPISTMAGSTLFLSGSHLQIINVYFFQLVMITILSSALHALIFLPLLLSFGGSRSHRNRNVVPHVGCLRKMTSSSLNCEQIQLEMMSATPKWSLDHEKLLDPLLEIEKTPEDRRITLTCQSTSPPPTPTPSYEDPVIEERF